MLAKATGPRRALAGADGKPVSPADFGPEARRLFLSEGRHVGLHARGEGLHRARRRVQQGRHLDPRRLQGRARKSHAKFAAKYGLKVPLATDVDGSVCEAFGTWAEKSMYGRKYMGIERATFLVDRDGVVKRVWRKVKVTGHAEEVLEAARALP